MKCQQIIDRLDVYLDGTLSVQEMEQFQQHIEGCPDCQDLSRQIFQVQSRYRINVMEPFWSPLRVGNSKA